MVHLTHRFHSYTQEDSINDLLGRMQLIFEAYRWSLLHAVMAIPPDGVTFKVRWF